MLQSVARKDFLPVRIAGTTRASHLAIVDIDDDKLDHSMTSYNAIMGKNIHVSVLTFPSGR